MQRDETVYSNDLKVYKHFDDPRQDYEIQLTNRLARSLSQINLNNLDTPFIRSSAKKLKKQDFLYVCLSGLPPFENQFKFLELPGEILHYKPKCFSKNISDEQALNASMELEILAQQLSNIIDSTSVHKPIVAVFHSFGTYVFAQYCHMFKNNRIIGIIDIGGAPIRLSPNGKSILSEVYNISVDTIKQTLDERYKAFSETRKKMGLETYERKAHLFGVYKFFKSEPGFKVIFDYIRNYPKVLKCFIYGRKDPAFLEHLENEKVTYFSYVNKFQSSYDQNLKKTYEKCFGEKCQNVQEKFIYSLQGGFHSVHMQKKYKQINAKIVLRYLTFVEEIFAQKGSNL